MSPSHIHNVRRIYRIASIPADGIGPEVISAGIEVLEKLAVALGEFEFQFDHYGWGSEYYMKHGKYIPDGGLEDLKRYNAILFGSVGAPDVPDHISLWGLRLASMDPFYANRRFPFFVTQLMPTQSASPCNSMPTCALPRSYVASHHLSEIASPVN